MTQSHRNTADQTFKHLQDTQRGRLEELAKQGIYTQAQMAEEIGVDQSTVSRELARGRTRQLRSNRTYYYRYLADAGARVYKENRERSRAKDYRKYSTKFLKELPEAIISTKNSPRIHSVDTFVHTYRRKHPDEHVPCTKTVYNLIDQRVLSVKNMDLPMKPRMRLRKKHPSDPKGTNTKHLGRSIDERDPAVLERKEPGHWEIDLMMGQKAKTEPVIITLIERKTRLLLTKKVWGQSAETIQHATMDMIKQQGTEYVKTLTTDNGSEFSTLPLIEDGAPHLKVFFAHAYAAWEKGTNERHNGLLREFIPKAQSLKDLRYVDLQNYTNAINARPRRMFNYKSPYEVFEHEHPGCSCCLKISSEEIKRFIARATHGQPYTKH